MRQFLAAPLLGGVLLLASSPPAISAVGRPLPFAPIKSQTKPPICSPPPPLSPPSTVETRPLPKFPAIIPPVSLTNLTDPTLVASAANSTVAYQQIMRYPLLRQVPISSNFGMRVHPITGQAKTHTGVDFAADYGIPVVAALSGRVIYIGEHGGYGNVVTIQHSDNTYTFYAHLQDFYTESGAWVEQGMPIATVGSTGFSTGPHLHFEVRQTQDGQWFAVDPGKYINLR